jgi:dolichol-phosphate mannosyltransferase
MFLLGPKALRAAREFTERNITLEGMFGIMGFRQAHIQYSRRYRTHGTSKWTLGKKIKLFIDGAIGFTYFPIRLLSGTGLVVATMSFAYAIFLIVHKLLYNSSIAGWPSIMVVMTLLLGLIMIMLGLLGEYLWRTLDEVRKRPRFFVDDTINMT